MYFKAPLYLYAKIIICLCFTGLQARIQETPWRGQETYYSYGELANINNKTIKQRCMFSHYSRIRSNRKRQIMECSRKRICIWWIDRKKTQIKHHSLLSVKNTVVYSKKTISIVKHDCILFAKVIIKYSK